MQIKSLKINTLRLENQVILAPMAGITSLPYRMIMKSFGASLVFSEMISANGLIRDGQKTRQLLASHPEEFPLGIQLFGDDPKVLATAVEMVKEESALIDINMGCPVKKVVRSGAGSALLQDPPQVALIIKAIRKIYSGPLTIKIRSGWDDQSLNFLEIGHIAETEGVDAITLHPRPRSQGFSGEAHWEQIAELKAHLNTPVFGSGDIFHPEDGLRMLQQTNCDAIMLGRGGYGNPWLISQIIQLLEGKTVTHPTPIERFTVAAHHLQLHHHQFGEKKTFLEIRKHLCWYARGLTGASQFRAQLQQLENLDQTLELTEQFFSQAEPA
jgi:nifR3 family TIM-barrel protein